MALGGDAALGMLSPVSPALSPDWIEEEMQRIGGSQQVLVDDRLVVGGVRGLLTRNAIQSVPAEVKKQMKSVLMVQIANLLIPVIRRWMFTRMRSQMKFSDEMKESAINSLRKSSLLEFWPDEPLRELVSASYPVSTKFPDIVLHQGERASSGIFTLLHGSVKLATRTNTATELRGSLEAPQIFGLDLTCTDEPHTSSVSTSSPTCLWMVTPLTAFKHTLSLSPPSIQERVAAITHKRRLQNLKTHYKMTCDDLRKSLLFTELNDAQCELVLDRLTPRVLRHGEVMLQNKSLKEMYFIKRGCLELTYPVRMAASVTSMTLNSVVLSDEETPDAVVRTTNDVINDSELYYGEKPAFFITAETTTDIWVLAEADLKEILCDNDVSQLVRIGAKRSREAQLIDRSNTQSELQKLHKCVSSTPIIAENTSHTCKEEIVRALMPQHYTALDPILFTPDPCDRLMYIVQGHAVVGNAPHTVPVVLEEGLGFTCTVDHRWTQSVFASGNCHAWVLGKDELKEILRRHGVLTKVQTATKALMNSPRPNLNVKHKTPALYPTQSSVIAPGRGDVRRGSLKPYTLDSPRRQSAEQVGRDPTPPRLQLPAQKGCVLQNKLDFIIDKANRNIPVKDRGGEKHTPTKASIPEKKFFSSPLSVREGGKMRERLWEKLMPVTPPVSPPKEKEGRRRWETRSKVKEEIERPGVRQQEPGPSELQITVIPNYCEKGYSKVITLPPPPNRKCLYSTLVSIFSPDNSLRVGSVQRLHGTELEDFSLSDLATGDVLLVNFKIRSEKQKKKRPTTRAFSPFSVYLPSPKAR